MPNGPAQYRRPFPEMPPIPDLTDPNDEPAPALLRVEPPTVVDPPVAPAASATDAPTTAAGIHDALRQMVDTLERWRARFCDEGLTL